VTPELLAEILPFINHDKVRREMLRTGFSPASQLTNAVKPTIQDRLFSGGFRAQA
jgi:hypothetical protein